MQYGYLQATDCIVTTKYHVLGQQKRDSHCAIIIMAVSLHTGILYSLLVGLVLQLTLVSTHIQTIIAVSIVIVHYYCVHYAHFLIIIYQGVASMHGDEVSTLLGLTNLPFCCNKINY